MERTSLLTRLALASSLDYPDLTLVDGIPDASSLSTYFNEVPIVLEQGSLTEQNEDNSNGDLLNRTIRAAIHRDAEYDLQGPSWRMLAYWETANGEQGLWGTDDSPLRFSYGKNSGSGNADPRYTTIELAQRLPI